MLYYKIENYIQLVVHNNSENLRTTPFDNFESLEIRKNVK